MKIYFAGNAGAGNAGKYRELLIKNRNGNRLFSYFWSNENEIFYKNFLIWKGQNDGAEST